MARGNPRISLRLEPGEVARLTAAAEQLELPVSEIVRVAIQDKLDELVGMGVQLQRTQGVDGQIGIEEVER